MQLKLTRSQRESGVVSKSVIFCLDARIQLTPDEQANVNRYKLGSQVIYNSEASKRHLAKSEAAQGTGTAGGIAKSFVSLARAALNLNITINGLQRGQHIECKSLDELLGAEEALMEACQNLRAYLDTAASFDGREVLVDFSGKEPAVVSTTPKPALVAPQTYMAPPPDPALPPTTGPAQVYERPPPPGEAWNRAPSSPDRMSVWLDDRLAVLGRYWRAASTEKQVLIIALGLLVIVVLYAVL